MHPVLFEVGTMTVYSYGFMIALGILAGMTWLVYEGKRQASLSFDQANILFLLIFVAALVGGKLFLFFEDPAGYLHTPERLFTGRGFVFYGSFLLAVPAMLWFFRRHKLPVGKMLDVMAIATCLVHAFGRTGCFLAGCCHGKPSDSFLAVTYTDPACYAQPLHTPLFPTQLVEAVYILLVMLLLLFFLKRRMRFNGQLFLSYIIAYAVGRFFLEFTRGDAARGFVLDEHFSHSQFIAAAVLVVVGALYVRQWRTSVQLPPS